jgi:hypothetical protein
MSGLRFLWGLVSSCPSAIIPCHQLETCVEPDVDRFVVCTWRCLSTKYCELDARCARSIQQILLLCLLISSMGGIFLC